MRKGALVRFCELPSLRDARKVRAHFPAVKLQQIESVKEYRRALRAQVESLEQLKRRSALFVEG
jgi:hypothetical protein